MKLGKILAPVFGILGLVLMIATVGLSFASLDAQPRGEVPQEAITCGAKTLLAISEGDFTAAAEQMYGQPDLGVAEELSEEAAAVWEIFRSGITCWPISNDPSDYYVSGSGFAVDVQITVPQISTITDSLTDHAGELMNRRIAAAEEMAEIYDDSGNFRQDVVADVLKEAMDLSLAEEPESMTVQATLGLVYRDGKWWAVPDENLLNALSGGLA